MDEQWSVNISLDDESPLLLISNFIFSGLVHCARGSSVDHLLDFIHRITDSDSISSISILSWLQNIHILWNSKFIVLIIISPVRV